MKTALAATLVAGSGVLLAPAAHAVCVRTTPGAVEVRPADPCSVRWAGGDTCRFVSSSELTPANDTQSGWMDAGPLVAGVPGTLYCSIHVDNNTHSGAAQVTEPFPATGGVVSPGPRPLVYAASEADDVALCARWVPDSGPTVYWVSGNPSDPTDAGHWSTNPGDPCGVAALFRP